MDKHDTLLLSCSSSDERKLLAEILRDSYNLLEADNSQQMELLLWQNRNCIAAIVTDMAIWEQVQAQRMDDFRGGASEPLIPAILICQEDTSAQLNRGFDLGAADVIPLSYDAAAMLRRIETIVQLHLHRQHLQTMVEEQAKALNQANERMVDALSSIIEHRSAESGQHILRIRHFTKILLEEVRRTCPEYQLNDEIISIISSASALHDVGKISIPDAILMKPGKLTEDERVVMKNHAVMGCQILNSLRQVGNPEYLRYAHNICHYHHERWDGSGYPEGLVGDSIPICAQVVGLADAYDALTSKRVYKDAYSLETAVNMILKGECGAFSPKLLECFKHVAGQYELLATSYADGLAPQTEHFDVTLPAPVAQEGVDSLNIVEGKFLCLLHYINGFVLEVSVDQGHYHLRYNPYPELARIGEASSLADLADIILNEIVWEEDRARMQELLETGIETYLQSGMRRQSFRFRFRDRNGHPEHYDVTFLRANVNQKKNRSMAVLCRKSAELAAVGQQADAPDLLAENSFVCRNDRHLTLVRFGSETGEIAGYSRAEMTELFQNRLIRVVHPEDRELLLDLLREQFGQSQYASVQYRVICKDGSVRWILSKNCLAVAENGEEQFHSFVLDNTQAHSAYDQLQDKLRRYEIILTQTENTLFEWDIREDTISFSDTWEQIFGFAPIDGNVWEQLSHGTFFHPDDVELVADRIAHLEQGSHYEMAEVRVATAKGRYLWFRFRASAVRDEAGNLTKICGIIINIDAEKQSSQALQERAERDALTKLLNKYAGRKQAEEYFARYPKGVDCAMLMIDLDNFKPINDRYGHLFGDTVLTQAARVLKRMFRNQDIITRVGGDEFTILMRGISDRELLKNRCQQLIGVFGNTFRHLNEEMPLSCSIGVAVGPEHGLTYHELYKHADHALYQAKAQGKNTYAFYDPSDVPAYAHPRHNTSIDSDQEPGLAENSLVQYAFQRLYASEDVEASVNEILELVGKKMNVSRVYIFENSDDNRSCDNTYEWCNEGIAPEIENLKGIRYKEDLAGYLDMYDENGIFYCPDIQTLPRNIYEILEPQGIKSLLHCAILDKGVFRGYIGFDECATNRMWTKEQIDALTYLSEMLSVFLMKKRQQEKALQQAEEISSILDNQNAWIYLIDPETCQLKYLNAKTRQLAPDAKVGMCCYEVIMGRDARCEGCPCANIRNTRTDSAVMFSEKFDLRVQADATLVRWDGEESCLLTCRSLARDTEKC